MKQVDNRIRKNNPNATILPSVGKEKKNGGKPELGHEDKRIFFFDRVWHYAPCHTGRTEIFWGILEWEDVTSELICVFFFLRIVLNLNYSRHFHFIIFSLSFFSCYSVSENKEGWEENPSVSIEILNSKHLNDVYGLSSKHLKNLLRLKQLRRQEKAMING